MNLFSHADAHGSTLTNGARPVAARTIAPPCAFVLRAVDAQEIYDVEYDGLFTELQQLEEACPALRTPDSPAT